MNLYLGSYIEGGGLYLLAKKGLNSGSSYSRGWAYNQGLHKSHYDVITQVGRKIVEYSGNRKFAKRTDKCIS